MEPGHLRKKQRRQYNEATGITWFNSSSPCAQLKVCQDYLWPEWAYRLVNGAFMSGSPAPHVWWSPLELLFYFSGREKTYTKRSNHTGDPGCNHGSVCLPPQWATRPFIWATDCAESIFKLFNCISCSKWGGSLARRIKTLAVANYF